MSTCVTCGNELHPERAEKYDYCTAPDCQAKNLRGLTMVAVGVNKAADQYQLLDERTREDMALGRYHDQRRESPGKSAPSAPTRPAAQDGGAEAERVRSPQRATDARGHRSWSSSQERLALLYNQQGMRPDEIAGKLGLSRYTVTQIILTSRNRGKL